MWTNTTRSTLKQAPKQAPKPVDRATTALPNARAGADFILPGGLGGFDPAYGPAIGEITYFTVLRILSESVGKLPIHVKDGDHKVVKNTVERILNLQPNAEQTPVQMMSYLEYCRNHYGNGYAYCKWSEASGELEAVIPLSPLQTRIWIDDTADGIDQRHYYSYTALNGTTWFLPAEDVIHVRNWHVDDRTRLLGIPVRETLHEYMTAAQAGQKTQDDLYRNGMIMSGVLNYVGDLNEEKKKTLLENIKKIGTKNKIIPLPKDWELRPINLSLADSQYLETRKYTASQIAAAYGVNPNQLNDYSKGSYANSTAQSLAFLTDTLLYISRQYEDEMTLKLLTSDEIKNGYRVDMDTEAILRSTPETLARTLQTYVTSSIMQINEARDKVDLPPVDGGDKLMTMPGASTVQKEEIIE